MSGSSPDTALIEALSDFEIGTHAVLFYGAPGAPMPDRADSLAKLWLCTDAGGCKTCDAFEAGLAVDYQRVEPWGAGNMIRLSAIVTPAPQRPDDYPGSPLTEFFRTRPMAARHKVMAFHRADRLSVDAANAMLKTLEEPHFSGKIVLTTDSIGRVLPTVRSRCLCVAVPTERADGDGLPSACFGRTPGLRKQVEDNREAYDELLAVLERASVAPPVAAILLAEQLRACGEALASVLGLNARQGHCEALSCAASWAMAQLPPQPDLAFACAEAHRMVAGNVNVGPATDELMTRWVGRELVARISR